MKRIRPFAAMTLLVMAFSTCDEMDPGASDPEKEKPEPTMVGIPNGIPVSKTIGSGGGLVAIDGAIEIEIPVGALSADTEITIQPVSNNAPNGAGSAYRLGPDGTNFSKAVKITLPYSPTVDGAHLTGIAFQDEDGIWYSNGKLSWNETNNTVTMETTHFSDYATFDVLKIVCNSCEFGTDGAYKLKINESADFEITTIADDALRQALGDAELVPLTRNAYDMITKEWLANGAKAETMTTNGLITVSSKGCTYTAPAKVPGSGKNPVNLSVTLKDLLYKDPKTGTTFSELQLATAVRIVGDTKYELVVRYQSDDVITGGLVGAAFTVKDSVTIQVLAKGDGSIICSDFVNSPGVITPTAKTDPTGNKSTVTSDSFLGPIHATECSGLWGDAPNGNRRIQFIVTGSSELPAFVWVSPLGGQLPIPKSTGGLMQIFIFDIIDNVPKLMNPNDNMAATLTLKE